LNPVDLVKFDAMRERMVGGLENLYSYEAFTGHTFLNWNQVQADANNYISRITSITDGVPIEVTVPLSQIIYENRNAFISTQLGYIRVNIPVPSSGTAHLDTLWNRLVDNATENLLPALRLSPYLDLVNLNITDAGIGFDFTALNTTLSTASAANLHIGTVLFLDLYRAYGDAFNKIGWNGAEQLLALMQRVLTEADVRSAFSESGFASITANTTTGNEIYDVFSGDATSNTFNGNAGNDLIDGQAENDSLSGGIGNDIIFGNSGNDSLNGNDGNDTLDGDTDNDQLTGGLGNNTYLFGKEVMVKTWCVSVTTL
jgi:hypothetical protein